MTASAQRHDPRQKFFDDLGYVLMRMRLVPGLANIENQSVAKRKAGRPAAWMTYPIAAGVAFADRTVPSRAGPMTLRVYTPSLPSGRPPVLYIHGGGWITGGLDSCHWLCAELASRLSTVVVSVDYRLAPEDPFPAALEDCQDALGFLAAHGIQMGVEGSRVVVGGDSAGGNLAAALAYWDARNGRRIVQQLLIYPALDLTLSSPSQREGLSRLLTPEALGKGVEHYLGRDGDPKDPLVSPLLAESAEGLAPAVILTAQHDPLRDDGKLFADKLAEAGVPVAYRNYGTMGHGFFSTPRLCRESAQALTDLISLARAQLPWPDTGGAT
jgi:acetyl esterase